MKKFFKNYIFMIFVSILFCSCSSINNTYSPIDYNKFSEERIISTTTSEFNKPNFGMFGVIKFPLCFAIKSFLFIVPDRIERIFLKYPEQKKKRQLTYFVSLPCGDD